MTCFLSFLSILLTSLCHQTVIAYYAGVGKPASYETALSSCENNDMYLPMVLGPEANLDLSNEINDSHVVWINAQKEIYPWRWAAGDSVNSEQGCFKERVITDIGSGVLPHYRNVTLEEFTAEKCMSICKNNYNYASMRIATDYQKSVRVYQCGCGDTFLTMEFANMPLCPHRCTTRTDGVCGEPFYNRIYHVSGKPGLKFNDFGASSSDACASLTRLVTNGLHHYWQRVKPCTSVTRILCDIPTPGNGSCLYSYISSDPAHRCIIDMDSAKATWYEAQRVCQGVGGFLAEVTTEQMAREIWENAMPATPLDPVDDYKNGFWIGLTKNKWTYANGTGLQYSNFIENSATDDLKRCAVIRLAGGWREENCGAHNSFLCYSDVVPVSDCSPGVDGDCSRVQEVLSGRNIAIIVVVLLASVAIIIFIIIGVCRCYNRQKCCWKNSYLSKVQKKRTRAPRVTRKLQPRASAPSQELPGPNVGNRKETRQKDANPSEVGQESATGNSIYILSADIPDVPEEGDGSSGSAEYPEGDTLDRRPMQYASVSADPRPGAIADPSFVVEEPIYSRINKPESGLVPS